MRSLTPTLVALAVSTSVAVGGCDGAASSPDGATGTLKLALGGPVADVTGLDYEVDCGGVLYTAYVDLEAEELPAHVDPDLAGSSFGDYFLTVPEGPCEVTVTPMQAPGVASELCQPTSTGVTITAGQTTEVLLVINCEASATGGLDVVTVVNQAPVITEIQVSPALSVAPCTPVSFTVKAHDLDGDPLTYDFLVSGPGETYDAVTEGVTLVFTAGEMGDWEITARVNDGHTTTKSTVTLYIEDSASCE